MLVTSDAKIRPTGCSTRVGGGGGGDESRARTHCINVISGGGVRQGNYVTRETTISSEAR